jgi:hypothetical protein
LVAVSADRLYGFGHIMALGRMAVSYLKATAS